MLSLISVTGLSRYFAAVAAVTVPMVCAAMVYLAPTPSEPWAEENPPFESKPCLVAASEHYADDGIEVGARAAVSYCEAEDAYDLGQIQPPVSESVRQLIHNRLTRDAAVMIAEHRAKR
jgi:hypothetical protein